MVRQSIAGLPLNGSATSLLFRQTKGIQGKESGDDCPRERKGQPWSCLSDTPRLSEGESLEILEVLLRRYKV